jgi:hypothetical protein
MLHKESEVETLDGSEVSSEGSLREDEKKLSRTPASVTVT